MRHYVASSGTQSEAQLELFCTGVDRTVALGLYLPHQWLGQKKQGLLSVSIDNKTFKLKASLHAMAVTLDNVSETVIKALKQGNRLQMEVEQNKDDKIVKVTTVTLNLRGSATAIDEMMNSCKWS